MPTGFISYRRDTAGSFALLLYDKMKSLGFDIYLDHKEMHSGKFDLQIQENLRASKDFILILSENSLLRNGEPRDFYLEEIELARNLEKENKIKIIPIFLKNFNDKLIYDKTGDIFEDILTSEGVNEGPPQLFETQFIPRLIELMSDSYDKQQYLLSKDQTVFSSRKIIEKESLSERWNGAKSISICAYYADQLINSDLVINKLKEGVNFRYLVVDPKSKAAEDAAKFKLCSGFNYRMRKFNLAHISAIDTLSMLDEEQIIGSFEMRETSLFIPNAIMIVEKDDEVLNTVKVDFYTFNTEDEERRSVLIKSGDKENYDFFVKQFEYIWNSDQTKAVTVDDK